MCLNIIINFHFHYNSTTSYIRSEDFHTKSTNYLEFSSKCCSPIKHLLCSPFASYFYPLEMDLQNFLKSQKHSIFFIIFTSLANYVLSLDPKFQACRSFTCGDGQYIRYNNLSMGTQTLSWSAKTKTQFSQLPLMIISLRISFTQTSHFLWPTPQSMSTHALLLCIILALIKLHLVLVWIIVWEITDCSKSLNY